MNTSETLDLGSLPSLPAQCSPQAHRAAHRLQQALPATELLAVTLWLATFFPYQLDWLLDFTRYALLLKARQIGASHTFGAACALWAMLGELTTIVSVGQREALEVLTMAERHLTVLAQLGSKWALPADGKDKYRYGEELRVASGGRILALPSTSGGRGFSGNIILDEFAYHDHPEKVWDGASAVTMHGYKLRVLSTPCGVGNLFHQLWTDDESHKGYRLHQVTIDQAMAQGLRVRMEECWKMARGDPRLFDQLFRCSFLDGDEQYIPTSAIKAASRVDTALSSGETYGGLDIGLTNDLSALLTIRENDEEGGRPWVQEVVTCKRTEWEKQLEMIDQAFERWNWRRLAVDSTGLGAVPAEMLVKRFGGRIIDGKARGGRVEPVFFTPTMKEELATTLYGAFNDKTAYGPTSIIIPTGEFDLRQDLYSLKRIVTSAGNVRYDAERTERGHADRAWALALALHARKRPHPPRGMGRQPVIPFA